MYFKEKVREKKYILIQYFSHLMNLAIFYVVKIPRII